MALCPSCVVCLFTFMKLHFLCKMVSKGIPCVVCHVTKHERPELSFHTFPKNKKRALEWINALRHEPLREKNLDQIIRSNRLCSLHFSGANYVQGKNSSRLRWDACPDTFLGDGNMDVLPPSINDEDQSEFASYSENIDVMPQYDSITLHFTYEQQFEIAPDFKYPSPRKILHNIHGSSNKKQEDTVSQCNITDDRGRVSDFRSASSDSFNQEHEDIIAEERNDDAGTASAFRSVFSDCCNQEHEHTIPELNISDDRSASSIADMVWTGEHRDFAVRAYFENNQSVIATQRAFRRQFNIPRNNAVPQANTIRSWVRQFEATGSTLRRDAHGRSRSIRTPENVDRVRAAIIQSPGRSARSHAVALGISSRSLRRILHMDLNFHPNKEMMAQELNEADTANRQNLCDQPSNCQNTGARKSKCLSGKETKLKNKIPPSRKRRRKVFGTPEKDSVFVIEEINTNIGKESKIACEEEVSSQEGGSDMDPLEENIFIKQESIDHEEGEDSLSESKILNSSEGMQMKEEVIIKEEYVEAFDFTDWD
ncbi:uncharacterized protein LOC122243317 isoform X2 [Penaeus japonicus]|uniref:uncharacterized protein LOC122243317 isoform X2 n=1 Tax=Penaeus japonicus TaxID=27405 RepID=UPI001C712C1C|nr:uncharacterized protein LOC122243317 isoform X2 [Penaeus japonicus]